jgi:hypothetical protein
MQRIKVLLAQYAFKATGTGTVRIPFTGKDEPEKLSITFSINMERYFRAGAKTAG